MTGLSSLFNQSKMPLMGHFYFFLLLTLKKTRATSTVITSHQKLAEFRILNIPNIEAESWEVISKPHIRLKSLNLARKRVSRRPLNIHYTHYTIGWTSRAN